VLVEGKQREKRGYVQPLRLLLLLPVTTARKDIAAVSVGIVPARLRPTGHQLTRHGHCSLVFGTKGAPCPTEAATISHSKLAALAHAMDCTHCFSIRLQVAILICTTIFILNV
jgi:hypothetical protein